MSSFTMYFKKTSHFNRKLAIEDRNSVAGSCIRTYIYVCKAFKIHSLTAIPETFYFYLLEIYCKKQVLIQTVQDIQLILNNI